MTADDDDDEGAMWVSANITSAPPAQILHRPIICLLSAAAAIARSWLMGEGEQASRTGV